MLLKINNYVINAPIWDIVKKIKSELTNGKLKDIQDKGDNIRVSCPTHKNGKENHASCDIYCGDSPDVEYGFFKCFTCGEQGSLWHFVAECFDETDEFGKEWLIERFGNIFVKQQLILPPINLKNKKECIKNNLAEKISFMQDFHPYMIQRKLSKEIIDKFQIKYDKETKCIVFPVWDEYDNLVMLTRRSVVDKTFIIDKDCEKPVYLLNYIKKNNIKEVAVCESQINALTCWSYGIPAVALFGTGSKNQYEALNKSGIRIYNLCFDGDDAGDKGRDRFIKNIRKDVLVNVINIPRGKDINDLEKNYVENLFKSI